MRNSQKAIKIETLVRASSYAIGLVGFISVVRYIDITYSTLFILLFTISGYLDIKQKNLLPRWLLNIISLIFVAIGVLRFNMEDPVSPVVETLLILLSIKFLETKSIRDYMQIYLIAILLLAGSALLSINIEFAIYLLTMMFLLSISTVSLTYYSQDKDLIIKMDTIKSLVLKSLLIPAMAIPITALLFFILPRTQYPLLNFLNRDAAVTGFTDHIRLGNISDIQIDETIIMRVKMKPIEQEMFYWRGIVLDYFDGISWRNSGSEILPIDKTFNLKGKRVDYTVYLEPYQSKYIFYLDKPSMRYIRNVTAFDDLTYILSEDLNRRIRYDATSIISGVLPDKDINKDKYLQLPKINLQKINLITQELTKDKDGISSAEAIMKYLKYGDFKYSMTNLPVTSNPLEDFLFKHKSGNCEYFASAMTVMLRMSQVPARIVGGYKGGYYNEIGGYYVIPQKNAHVWVEAYIDKKGWLRYDPTPPGGMDFSAWRGGFIKLRVILDALNFHWNALIINYNFQKQINLINKARLSIQHPQFNLDYAKKQTMQVMPFVVIIFIISIFTYLYIIKGKSYEERIISQFLSVMKKKGYEKTKSEGLEEFANKINPEDMRAKAIKFIQTFEAYFYKDKKLDKEDYRKLKLILKDLINSKS